MRILGKRHYVKNIIAAGGFGLQWSSRRPESRCVSVGTLYVHVSLLTCSRLFPRRREGCREWEWGERGGGGGGRGNSAALPSDCVVKGVQPSPVGPHTRGLRGDRGEGNQPASVTHPPLMLRSIPQTRSQIATGAPTLLIVSSSSPHHPPRCLLIYTLIDVSRLSRPHSITHPPPPPPTSSFSLLVFHPLLPPPSPLSSFPSTRNVSALFTLQSSDFLTR